MKHSVFLQTSRSFLLSSYIRVKRENMRYQFHSNRDRIEVDEKLENLKQTEYLGELEIL